jgi:hypothetical protein
MKIAMTKLFYLFLLGCWVVSIPANAQDIIVKSNNDTIFCKIIEVSDSIIQYKTAKNHRITTNSISTKYIANYFLADSTTTDNKIVQNMELPNYQPALWVSASGGYSWMMGKLLKTGNSNVDALNEELMNGLLIEASAEYFFKWKPNNTNYGLALNMVYNRHAAKGFNIPVFDLGVANNYSEVLSKFYVGPAFAMVGDYKNIKTSGVFGLGILHISDKMNADYISINPSTIVLGTYVGCKFDYKLSPQDAIGVHLTMVTGSYDELKSDEVTVTFSEKMSASSWHILLAYSHRIDLGKK